MNLVAQIASFAALATGELRAVTGGTRVMIAEVVVWGCDESHLSRLASTFINSFAFGAAEY
jgi:hypothetical protein